MKPTMQTLNYALIISGALYNNQNASSAYLFARALIEKGHKIGKLFFYQDGVYNASIFNAPANDEFDLHKAWCELAEQHNIELAVCVAASLRRGILDSNEAKQLELPAYNLQAPFVMTGLGQFAQALLEADRVIQF